MLLRQLPPAPSLPIGPPRARRADVSARTPVRVRTSARRALLVVLIIGASAVLALHDAPAVTPKSAADDPAPWPSLARRCRLLGDEAYAHAGSLEQLADARWQRVPFALHEAPHALLEMSEAEACYSAASDRVGRMRAGAKRRLYEAEVQRRVARARLVLRAETRGDSRQQDAPTPRARQQVAILLALLERAGPSAEPLRRQLQDMARRHAALAAQQQAQAEASRTAPVKPFAANREGRP